MKALSAFCESFKLDVDLRRLGLPNCSHWESLQPDRWKAEDESAWSALRDDLFAFIVDYSDWDAAAHPLFVRTSRDLTDLSHRESTGLPGHESPLVFDPFAGGGAIPVECLRVGATAVASDLNPVPVTINRVLLEDIPRSGEQLAAGVLKWGNRLAEELSEHVADLFPSTGAKPIAYLYARTVLSEEATSAEHPVEIPLLRSLWLAKRKGGGVALRYIRDKKGKLSTTIESVTYSDGEVRVVRRPCFEVVELTGGQKAEKGPARGNAATCPVSTTSHTTPVESVRRQLTARSGGTEDARLVAVVEHGESRKSYRLPTAEDEAALARAKERLEDLLASESDSFLNGEISHIRGFINICLYGITTWRRAFTSRQALVLRLLADGVRGLRGRLVEEEGPELGPAIQRCLALAVDRLADYNSALCTWRADGEYIGHAFGQGQSLPMRLDFVEVNPLSESTGDWNSALRWVSLVCGRMAVIEGRSGQVLRANAAEHPLPDDSVDLCFTDPPYYSAVPYADLSDYFYLWLSQSLGGTDSLYSEHLTPKKKEIVALSHRAAMYREKDGAWFEARMAEAAREARRITKPNGLGVWVFASKETAAWEAMLSALVSSGWIITASWPIDTEMVARLRARNSAALGSSIHIVCRPREHEDGRLREDLVGDWRQVLKELPERIGNWLPRLAREGIVGADAIFACLGPALEIFSRYSSVEKTSGESVPLAEFLEQVWACVAREALSMVFESADAAGLEEDARLTAMWLWTVSTSSAGGEEKGKKSQAQAASFTFEFDAARKIAQGLGAHLEELAHVVEIDGSNARLLGVGERVSHLFGRAKEQQAKSKKKKKEKEKEQLDLFAALEGVAVEAEFAGNLSPAGGGTTLDRIHQAMILFAAGRAEAMKRFLQEDGVGKQARFWNLAQALSALYPPGTEEKRWVDGVLARKKSLGFA